jgi:hypothetical protein
MMGVNSQKYKGKRYFLDPLYGKIYFPDWIWKVIVSPELQRLREIRLCNINSLCLYGGANINRYEHAIGTCHLANLCINNCNWPFGSNLSENDKKIFLLAALLHDIISAPFGHSIEYVESKEGFEHENAFEYVVLDKNAQKYEYKFATFDNILFWKQPGRLYDIFTNDLKLSDEDITVIGKLISGKGRLGPLISGTMDIDNIDNVFRMAYHVGLYRANKTPQKIAESMWIESGKMIVAKESIHLVEEWYEVRKKLYLYLLLNPEEFSAKCMLTNAIERCKDDNEIPFKWNDTDYELLEKLSDSSSEEQETISRLMTGKLYGCIAIFASKRTDKYNQIQDVIFRRNLETELANLIKPESSIKIIDMPDNFKKLIKGINGIKYEEESEMLKVSTELSKQRLKKIIENESSDLANTIIKLSKKAENKQSKYNIKSPMIAIHPIQDKNKTMRQIKLHTDDNDIIEVGEREDRLLIGVFFKNTGLDMNNIDKLGEKSLKNIKNEFIAYLSIKLDDLELEDLELYGESDYD